MSSGAPAASGGPEEQEEDELERLRARLATVRTSNMLLRARQLELEQEVEAWTAPDSPLSGSSRGLFARQSSALSFTARQSSAIFLTPRKLGLPSVIVQWVDSPYKSAAIL